MIERIARRYDGQWLQGYARGKLRRDPAFAAVFELLKDSPLPVLDVGCGIGLLELYLRERGFAAPLSAIDFDAAKIARAKQAAGDDRVIFAEENVVSWNGRPGDDLRASAASGFRGNVVILDLLHYLDAETQRAVLVRAAECVSSGGMCLIRETPRDSSWRFRATQLEEWFLRASHWMKSGAIHFPTAEEIAEPFRDRGFSAEIRPLWGRTPFNSHLFVFRRIQLSEP